MKTNEMKTVELADPTRTSNFGVVRYQYWLAR